MCVEYVFTTQGPIEHNYLEGNGWQRSTPAWVCVCVCVCVLQRYIDNTRGQHQQRNTRNTAAAMEQQWQ